MISSMLSGCAPFEQLVAYASSRLHADLLANALPVSALAMLCALGGQAWLTHCLQADPVFTAMLADVRGGRCPAATLAALRERCARPLDTADGILPTQVPTLLCLGAPLGSAE